MYWSSEWNVFVCTTENRYTLALHSMAMTLNVHPLVDRLGTADYNHQLKQYAHTQLSADI